MALTAVASMPRLQLPERPGRPELAGLLRPSRAADGWKLTPKNDSHPPNRIK